MSRSRHIQAVDITQRERTIPNSFNNIPYNRKNSNSFLQKLRSPATQNLISGSCTSMRDFCTSIQSLTGELNTLLSSIENLLPLINTYLTQPRENVALPTKDNQIKAQPQAISNQSTMPNTPIKQPRTEDIQQLLENPLVKNLLTSFMQNSNKS